jgi:hypothetical protein
VQEQERSEILTEMPEGTGEEELLGQGTAAARALEAAIWEACRVRDQE